MIYLSASRRDIPDTIEIALFKRTVVLTSLLFSIKKSFVDGILEEKFLWFALL